MINIYDIAIVGAGVAGCFASLRIAEKYPDAKTILLDLGKTFGKRRRFLEGALGCFPNSDGKIYINDLDKVSNIVDGRKANAANKWVMEVFDQINPIKIVKDTLPKVAIQKRIKEFNFEIQTNDYISWKPDSIHQLSRHIANETENAKNIEFSFDNEVYKIVKKKDIFVISSANGDIHCKNIILCVGRSGWRWVNKLYKELGLIVNDDYARFGIRIEMPAQLLKDFNKSHCTLTREGLELGPFSYNGSIIPEDHADLVISAFRSNEERWKTDKVSFSVIASKYFKDNGVFQTERLGKLAFLLANDRVGRERIKVFLKEETELNLIPEYKCLLETLKELDGMIPNIIAKGYFHTPNILPMASQIRLGSNLESELEGMFVAGESASIPGILSAAITGTICSDTICK